MCLLLDCKKYQYNIFKKWSLIFFEWPDLVLNYLNARKLLHILTNGTQGRQYRVFTIILITNYKTKSFEETGDCFRISNIIIGSLTTKILPQ